MTENKAVTATANASGSGDDVDIERYLSENPTIADALRTFHVAEEQYRRSVQALTSVRVLTSQSANR